MTTRTVFMGSPEFALPSLEALLQAYDVVGVVTQPDRPAGRGRQITPPAVKELAESLGLPVIQPRRLRDPEAMQQLRDWQPDLIVVAAFGQILKPDVLDLPPHGCINVHASLLPRWRGAAPITAAIRAGDPEAGVTIMRMDPGIDTGPTLSRRALPILPDDTTATLTPRLAVVGARLLVETLPAYLCGELVPQPQPEEGATYAPMLRKEDGLLDFTRPAPELANQVRAFNPWPGAYTFWQGQVLKVHMARPAASPAHNPAQAGELAVSDGLPAVVTGDGLLLLTEVQPAGRKAMPGKQFLQGAAREWGE